jgi:hypothetical protein
VAQSKIFSTGGLKTNIFIIVCYYSLELGKKMAILFGSEIFKAVLTLISMLFELQITALR